MKKIPTGYTEMLMMNSSVVTTQPSKESVNLYVIRNYASLHTKKQNFERKKWNRTSKSYKTI